MSRRWRRRTGVLLVFAAAAGCAASHMDAPGTGKDSSSRRLTGLVVSREHILLPRDVLVQVELLDVSGKDGPVRNVAMQEIEPDGRQLPIPFDIPYRTAIIDPERSYTLRVKIYQGRRILYANTATYSVITNGVRNNIEVVVEQITGRGGVSR